MSPPPKKDLTNTDSEQKIWLKLIELVREKRYGQLTAKIIIHDGQIREIRYQDFEGVIR